MISSLFELIIWIYTTNGPYDKLKIVMECISRLESSYLKKEDELKCTNCIHRVLKSTF